MPMREWVKRGFSYLKTVLDEPLAALPKASMARFCALLFAVVGSIIGLVGAWIALHGGGNVNQVEVIKALAILATCFVASGAVALLTRSKITADNSDA